MTSELRSDSRSCRYSECWGTKSHPLEGKRPPDLLLAVPREPEGAGFLGWRNGEGGALSPLTGGSYKEGRPTCTKRPSLSPISLETCAWVHGAASQTPLSSLV